MKIHKNIVEFKSTTQIEFINITDKVQQVVDSSGIREGQVLIFSQHTTMGVTINHDESMLIQDLMRILYKLVPVEEQYSHDLFELQKSASAKSDGRSNGHSHCKAVMLGNSQNVPVEKGKLALSNKQSIFAVEFDGARDRNIFVQVIGL